MKIDMSKLKTSELAVLVVEAGQELQRRTTVEIRHVPAVEHIVEIREPASVDKDFVLYVRALVGKGGYIKAAERQRVAAIAAEYPDWFRRQGLPTDAGTGSWNRARQFMSSARARER